ncbi:MAG: integration host factor subunit beta [Holosporaceae bacterium]|jgi:integration host factor subunit beta|nr:integration host factor subunit beta [Holosporaceae bacterium]
MVKSDLIARISEIYPFMSSKNVARLISIVLDEMINALSEGRRIELRGFGAFSIRQREEKLGRNPRTGEKVLVKAKKVTYFRMGKHLKSMINKRADT